MNIIGKSFINVKDVEKHNNFKIQKVNNEINNIKNDIETHDIIEYIKKCGIYEGFDVNNNYIDSEKYISIQGSYNSQLYPIFVNPSDDTGVEKEYKELKLEFSSYPFELLPESISSLQNRKNKVMKVIPYHALLYSLLDNRIKDEWELPKCYIENVVDGNAEEINYNKAFKDDNPVYKYGMIYKTYIKDLRYPDDVGNGCKLCIQYPNNMVHQLYLKSEDNLTLNKHNIHKYNNTLDKILKILYYNKGGEDFETKFNSKYGLNKLIEKDDYNIYFFYDIPELPLGVYNIPAAKLMAITNNLDSLDTYFSSKELEINCKNEYKVDNNNVINFESNIFEYPMGTVVYVKTDKNNLNLLDLTIEDFIEIKNSILANVNTCEAKKILDHISLNYIKRQYPRTLARKIYEMICTTGIYSDIFIDIYDNFIKSSDNKYSSSYHSPLRSFSSILSGSILLVMEEILSFNIQKSDDDIMVEHNFFHEFNNIDDIGIGIDINEKSDSFIIDDNISTAIDKVNLSEFILTNNNIKLADNIENENINSSSNNNNVNNNFVNSSYNTISNKNINNTISSEKLNNFSDNNNNIISLFGNNSSSSNIIINSSNTSNNSSNNNIINSFDNNNNSSSNTIINSSSNTIINSFDSNNNIINSLDNNIVDLSEDNSISIHDIFPNENSNDFISNDINKEISESINFSREINNLLSSNENEIKDMNNEKINSIEDIQFEKNNNILEKINYELNSIVNGNDHENNNEEINSPITENMIDEENITEEINSPRTENMIDEENIAKDINNPKSENIINNNDLIEDIKIVDDTVNQKTNIVKDTHLDAICEETKLEKFLGTKDKNDIEGQYSYIVNSIGNNFSEIKYIKRSILLKTIKYLDDISKKSPELKSDQKHIQLANLVVRTINNKRSRITKRKRTENIMENNRNKKRKLK
jgi:hypothetical protein